MNDWVRIDEVIMGFNDRQLSTGFLSALGTDTFFQHTIDQALEGEKLPIL
jgi:hypothetical protein